MQAMQIVFGLWVQVMSQVTTMAPVTRQEMAAAVKTVALLHLQILT